MSACVVIRERGRVEDLARMFHESSDLMAFPRERPILMGEAVFGDGACP